MAVQVGIPREPVAFLLVTLETQIGHTDAVRVRLGGVLGVVEDEDIAAWSLGGNDARVLGHVAGPVHFPLVIDLDLNLDLAGDAAESAKLPLLVVVVRRVKLSVFVGQLN